MGVCPLYGCLKQIFKLQNRTRFALGLLMRSIHWKQVILIKSLAIFAEIRTPDLGKNSSETKRSVPRIPYDRFKTDVDMEDVVFMTSFSSKCRFGRNDIVEKNIKILMRRNVQV